MFKFEKNREIKKIEYFDFPGVTFWWKAVAVNWIYTFCQHSKCVGFIHRCSYLDKFAELTFNVFLEVTCSLSRYISCIFCVLVDHDFSLLCCKSYFLGFVMELGKDKNKREDIFVCKAWVRTLEISMRHLI